MSSIDQFVTTFAAQTSFIEQDAALIHQVPITWSYETRTMRMRGGNPLSQHNDSSDDFSQRLLRQLDLDQGLLEKDRVLLTTNAEYNAAVQELVESYCDKGHSTNDSRRRLQYALLHYLQLRKGLQCEENLKKFIKTMLQQMLETYAYKKGSQQAIFLSDLDTDLPLKDQVASLWKWIQYCLDWEMAKNKGAVQKVTQLQQMKKTYGYPLRNKCAAILGYHPFKDLTESLQQEYLDIFQTEASGYPIQLPNYFPPIKPKSFNLR